MELQTVAKQKTSRRWSVVILSLLLVAVICLEGFTLQAVRNPVSYKANNAALVDAANRLDYANRKADAVAAFVERQWQLEGATAARVEASIDADADASSDASIVTGNIFSLATTLTELNNQAGFQDSAQGAALKQAYEALCDYITAIKRPDGDLTLWQNEVIVKRIKAHDALSAFCITLVD